MAEKKYRFGIMVNRLELYPWQIQVYENLIKTGLAECAVVILRENADSQVRSLRQKITDKNLLFEQYKKRKLNTGLYAPTVYAPILQIPRIRTEVIRSGKAYEEINVQDITTIKNLGLDFIFRFGFGILKGGILEAARWGVWSFHHGDEQAFRGGPPGFWEMFHHSPMQGVILQQLTERLDAGKILLKRHYSVVRHSYPENVTKLFMSSVDMPAQAVRMIHSGALSLPDIEPVKTKAPVYHYPANPGFLRFLTQVFFQKWKFRFDKLFRQENWIIGYNENNGPYRYIAAPQNGEYYADPFTFNSGGKNYIVAEKYSYATQKGCIVLITPGSNQVTTVLEKDHHLAYPYIYQEDGAIYMIPEEGNSGTLHLYKWEPETQTFAWVTQLLDKPAVDASLLRYNGHYYLFTSLKGELPNEKLMIYHAEKLEGPYLPHTSNPVKITPAGSRMAGGFSTTDAGIIRHAQYSVNYYGEKIINWKINELSPSTFSEEYVSEMIVPTGAPFKAGIHTWHKNGTFGVIDLKTRRSGWKAFKAQW